MSRYLTSSLHYVDTSKVGLVGLAEGGYTAAMLFNKVKVGLQWVFHGATVGLQWGYHGATVGLGNSVVLLLTCTYEHKV